MSHSKHLYTIGQLDVDNMIRKPSNENAPDRDIRHSRHRRPRLGTALNARYGAIDHAEEVASESGSFAFVPAGRRGHIGVGGPADPNRALQRLRRSRSRRSRTWGHGSPGSAPDRVRAARSSISAAHAVSASSSAPLSRLAINSAARSARPAESSFRASSRSLAAALVTRLRVPRRTSPNKRMEPPGAKTAATRVRRRAGGSCGIALAASRVQTG